MKPYWIAAKCRNRRRAAGRRIHNGPGHLHALSHNPKPRSFGESTEENRDPIRKCSQNCQKTVFNLAVCFERIDIKRKASVLHCRPMTESKRGESWIRQDVRCVP